VFLDAVLRAGREQPAAEAMVYREQSCSYGSLLAGVVEWLSRLKEWHVPARAIVALKGDFSPSAIAAFLALIEHGCVVVPISDAGSTQTAEFLGVAQVEIIIDARESARPLIERTGSQATHPLYEALRAKRHPGLVLFSSGSTGASKAALHDLVPLLAKFSAKRHARRMLAFLLFDHIGGLNTLLYVISNLGCLITIEERTPEAVCAAIERYKVEVLPATPTFLHLLILSGAYERHDLSSLRLVTYGTEVMPSTTLQRFHEIFPGVDLQQTYGLSELGILRSKSKTPDSLWVRLGGEGYETRVRDGLLEIKAESAMLGYLNAESPFTEDGWFKTGDAVEVGDGFFRILGRRSELINVGGQKVFPVEVESVLQSMPGVVEAVVSGEPNAITGHIVVARIALEVPESLPDFRKRMHEFCGSRLSRYKIPQKVFLVDTPSHGARFKKMRRVT
jgi:acyl-coenzyme A synthetase/AMP-(fatty) acid ligase